MSKQSELVKMFSTAAKILDLKEDGGGGFRAISFNKVARLLKDGEVDVEKVHEEGGAKLLEKQKGIGKSSAAMIAEFIETGRSTDYDELAASVPAGLVPMFDLPGLGPKTIKLLWQEREIESVGDLKAAIDEGGLSDIKGLGAKKIQQMADAIELHKKAAGRRGIWKVSPVADDLLHTLRSLVGVAEAEAAGSLRRRQETCKDVDLIAKLKPEADPDAVTTQFAELPIVEKVVVRGPTKCSVLVADGLQVDLRIVPAMHWGATLMHFTGSKEHNKRLRNLAIEKKLTLNDWGLYKADEWEATERKPGVAPVGVKPVAAATEAEIYKKLGLAWVPPELREDRGEVELAADNKLPKLVTADDLRGDLHTHTVASDGRNTIEEMAEAAKELGYAFLGITDHSKSQVIANGLDADRLLRHVETIRGVNDSVKGIELLAGCEVDILADGRMDYGDDVLRELDFCVGSPHVALRQDRAKSTDRLLRAIENPYVTIIGHPTGRYINKREGLSPDFDKLFAAAAANGTAMEINASYPRLDLSDTLARRAKAAGVTLSINTDAHSTDGLHGMRGGLDQARRAGLEAADVLNTFTKAKLLKFIAAKRA